jgi:hypothetical protein
MGYGEGKEQGGFTQGFQHRPSYQPVGSSFSCCSKSFSKRKRNAGCRLFAQERSLKSSPRRYCPKIQETIAIFNYRHDKKHAVSKKAAARQSEASLRLCARISKG